MLDYPYAEHSYKRSVFSSAKYVFTSWGDHKSVMAPDVMKRPPQSLGKTNVQLPPTWLPLGTVWNRTNPGSNHPPTPGTLKPNCQFYSQIPKLNPSKHSDDLRFSKPIDHSVSDAGSQGELPVLGEEAGGGGGRGRPLQRTVRKEQLTVTQRSPRRSSA